MAAVMPNVETLAWLLPALGACFWVGAWLMAGSSRIAYAGVQLCYAFAIATFHAFGPTVDLAPATNRVLGVLLGIVVMGVVFECVWPVRASRVMRPALGAALRSMAGLAEITRAEGGYAAEVSRAARHRLAIYRDLATVLRLREEAALLEAIRANLASGAASAGPGAVPQLMREIDVRRYIAGHIERLARPVLDDAARSPGPAPAREDA